MGADVRCYYRIHLMTEIQNQENKVYPPKIFIAIVSCKKNGALRDAIRKTWLVGCPYRYSFFIGGTRPLNALSDEVYLDCPDTYEALAAKMMAIIDYVSVIDMDYLFKCDDDSYLNWHVISSVNIFGYDYIGRPVNCGDRSYFFNRVSSAFRFPLEDELDVKYAAGMGYFLSKKAMQIILSVAPKSWDGKMRFEDEYLGDILFRAGIMLREIKEVLLLDAGELFRKGFPKIDMNKILVIHKFEVIDHFLFYRGLVALLWFRYLYKTSRIFRLAEGVRGQIKRPHIPLTIRRLFKGKLTANG